MINNNSKKTYSKEESRIIEMIIDHGLNPMAAPNLADDIINYVNVLYNNKVMLHKMFPND